MRFSLKQLEYFLTVTETKSITLAAKQLNISSPSISTAITQLEKEFSLQLFVRKHATGLFLTPGGEKFAKATKLILQQSKDLYDLASNITNYASGPITLGCLSTLAPIIVPQLRRSYITKNPNEIEHRSSKERKSEIRERENTTKTTVDTENITFNCDSIEKFEKN